MCGDAGAWDVAFAIAVAIIYGTFLKIVALRN
jgi:hypothetical protein